MGQSLILTTIENIVKNGFDKGDIPASINTIEFSLREFNTGSFPKNLSLMLGIMSKWIYDHNPVEAIRFESSLTQVKNKIDKQGDAIFRDFLQKYFLDNYHRVTIHLIPDDTLERQQSTEEKKKLATIKASLNNKELQDIINSTKNLKQLQSR